MAPLEVIGAGYGRTGTDSLRTALNMLGYKTHHMKSFREDPTLDGADFYHAYYHRQEADWDKIYENYSAAVDWPTAAFYKELHAYYPDAKLILTVRSADSWYTSVKNTIASAQQRKRSEHSANQVGQDKDKARMAEVTCLDGRLADPEQFNDEEAIKRAFLEHNEEVKRIIPADQLLVMELGEGWDRLCQFLGKQVPNAPYPHVNSTKEHKRRREERRMKNEEDKRREN
ncbi:MAG: P-loop containing nucleoside triphosphate hydrolase protein [Benjaminiella poitrasii]|nr:MAG: P-loop containing nucleoside triphosphate hydrolase protein [Benjaminiella poitrasii]